jgi:uncharacterized protein
MRTNQVRAPRLNLRRQWYAVRGEDRFALPAERTTVETEDGERLAVSKLGSDPDVAIVLVHALLGYRTKPPWRRLAEALAEHATVYATDLRGHGDSTGFCSGGPLEANDVRAVVARARADGYKKVIAVGGSLGAAAVIFEAASTGSADAICAISPPSNWVADTLHLPAADGGVLRRRLMWLFGSPVAQVGAELAFGTSIAREWVGGEPPLAVADRIQVPTLVVHGDNDHLFPLDGVEQFVSQCNGETDLWVIEGFGHCEDGFGPEFCAQLGPRLLELIEDLDEDEVA